MDSPRPHLLNTVLPEQDCSECGYKFDRANGKEAPTEGYLNVCINCGHQGQYDAQLIVRGLSVEDLDRINSEYPESFDELMAASRMIRQRGMFYPPQKKSIPSSPDSHQPPINEARQTAHR